MTELLRQVEEIRRRAKVCPECGGTAKIEGDSVEEANNERGYIVIKGEWTCYKCHGTGQVAAPDIDALCDALVTLAQAVEAARGMIEGMVHPKRGRWPEYDALRQALAALEVGE